MIITIKIKDDHGWPRLFVDPPVVQNGDNVRVQNYARNKYLSLKREFDAHWEETKKARDRYKNNQKDFVPYALKGETMKVGKVLGNGEVKEIK